MKSYIITPTGELKGFVPAGKKFTLEELQRGVGGGYVERVKIPGGVMYVDEDGKIKGQPINMRASQLYGDAIAGQALVVEGGR